MSWRQQLLLDRREKRQDDDRHQSDRLEDDHRQIRHATRLRKTTSELSHKSSQRARKTGRDLKY